MHTVQPYLYNLNAISAIESAHVLFDWLKKLQPEYAGGVVNTIGFILLLLLSAHIVWKFIPKLGRTLRLIGYWVWKFHSAMERLFSRLKRSARGRIGKALEEASQRVRKGE